MREEMSIEDFGIGDLVRFESDGIVVDYGIVIDRGGGEVIVDFLHGHKEVSCAPGCLSVVVMQENLQYITDWSKRVVDLWYGVNIVASIRRTSARRSRYGILERGGTS